MRAEKRRSGFTLVELLVVIAIVAVIMGLLLPAAQKVRGAAARMACQNNLHQIGIALHHYHDEYRHFPPGFSSMRAKYPRSSFLTHLLPYLEQEPLWRASKAAYGYVRNPSRNPPHIGLAYPLPVFSCPSDGRTLVIQPTHKNLRVALTSYVGVLGTDLFARDGVLYVDSQVSLPTIRDGASNTIMVGERPPSPDFWFGWWYAGWGQKGTGSVDMLLGARERRVIDRYVAHCPQGPYHYGPGREDNQCDVFHFWSFHPGGAYFLFGDGSVRFLDYSADRILPALATRSGGEDVSTSP